MAFCDHWRDLSGADPASLVLDQKLTTQEVLGELDARGVRFMTLRMRSADLIRHIAAIDQRAWRTVHLDREGKYQKPEASTSWCACWATRARSASSWCADSDTKPPP